MIKKLGFDEDTYTYLRGGKYTKPFSSDTEQVEDSIRDIISENSAVINGRNDELTALFTLINSEINNKIEENKNNAKRYSRTAEEIYNSGKVIDQNDYALIFASIARQLRIPTTCLYAMERNDLKAKVNGQKDTEILTKTFCECFYDNEWVLVDPQNGNVISNYDPNLFEVKSWNTTKEYVGYLRGFDMSNFAKNRIFGKGLTVKDMALLEKEKCKPAYFETCNKVFNKENEKVL